MKEVGIDSEFELQDLKKEQVRADDIEFLATKVDKLTDLVNRRSRKIKELGIDIDQLSDKELKEYFQKEYTFIKRPICIIGDEVFIGNSKKTVEALKTRLAYNG